MSNTSRNVAVLGVALVAAFFVLERFSWWIPAWLLEYGAGATFATNMIWLLVLNVFIFALAGLLLMTVLRGFYASWLAMSFGLSYGAARLVLYSLGILPEAPFWLHPFVLAMAGISPLIGTALGALAFRRISHSRTHAT